MEKYKPSIKVLERLKEVTFVAVVGPTAVGKSTLIHAAVANDSLVNMVKTHTTRPPRPGEQHGHELYFETHLRMDSKIKAGEYVQYVRTSLGDIYATEGGDYFTSGASLMPTFASAIANFRSLSFKQVRTIYIVPPNMSVWQARLAERNFAVDILRSRMQEAEESMRFALNDSNIYFIINNNKNLATKDLITLALGKQLNPRLAADQALAREICANLLVGMQDNSQSRQHQV
jgi:guanylate kinase